MIPNFLLPFIYAKLKLFNDTLINHGSIMYMRDIREQKYIYPLSPHVWIICPWLLIPSSETRLREIFRWYLCRDDMDLKLTFTLFLAYLLYWQKNFKSSWKTFCPNWFYLFAALINLVFIVRRKLYRRGAQILPFCAL